LLVVTQLSVWHPVLSVVLTRFLEKNKELAIKRQEIEHEIREKHIPTYQELVQFLFKIFQSTKTGSYHFFVPFFPLSLVG
jgi:hypothetical protein